jgi:hypothetical protein
MSIIYEALKKAEREREPVPRGRWARRPARRQGRRGGTVAVASLVGGITVAGVWLWLAPPSWLDGGWRAEFVAVAPPASQDGAPGPSGGSASAGVAEPMPVPPSLKSESEVQPLPQGSAVPAPSPPITAAEAFDGAAKAEADGRWQEAVRLYRQAIALNPGWVEALNNLGHLYVRLNRIAEAIDQFHALLAVKPGYAVAHNNLGSAYALAGQHDRAVKEFLEAIRLDGHYVTPYYNLASVYARRGDAAQASIFLTKAMAMEPAVWSWVRDDPDFDAVRSSPEFQRWRAPRTARR